MFRPIVVVLILFVAIPACAKNRTVTIRGVVDWGTSDSGIYGLEPYCTFPTDSKIANEVFSTCQFLDDCEVNGIINENYELISLTAIKIIDTNSEPSVAVISQGAYWYLSILDKFNYHSYLDYGLTISGIHPVQTDGETFWEYDFKMTEKKSHTLRELGSGRVRLVKRGDKWNFFR